MLQGGLSGSSVEGRVTLGAKHVLPALLVAPLRFLLTNASASVPRRSRRHQQQDSAHKREIPAHQGSLRHGSNVQG